jgi:hypothetical protein
MKTPILTEQQGLVQVALVITPMRGHHGKQEVMRVIGQQIVRHLPLSLVVMVMELKIPTLMAMLVLMRGELELMQLERLEA